MELSHHIFLPSSATLAQKLRSSPSPPAGEKGSPKDSFTSFSSCTVVITAPPEIRVRRIMEREGISEEYARSRVRAQKPDEFFTSRCGYNLVSDCANPEDFAARAKALFEVILNP